MFTRAICIRPDIELIRESVCACAKLFVNEGNVHMDGLRLIVQRDQLYTWMG
jgi:hypothetical protein